MKCQVSKYLAYSMTIYTLASMYYVIRTRSIGTPFNDTLSENQKRIKKESADVRRSIFVEGGLAGAVIIILFQPFKSCH